MDPELFGRRMVELLPQLIRGFARQESNYLSRGKITLPQLWALERLSRQNRCSMNELARFLNVSGPAATGLIDRLIAQGLARREDDPLDRRVVRVNITPKGAQIIANIWEQKRRMFTQVFSRISAKDRAQYLHTLEQVVHILSQRPPKGAKGNP